MPILSPDGLIRLSLDELRSIQLTHLISGLDEDCPDNTSTVQAALSVPNAHITGYTEWVSPGTPAITIGWDWKMVGEHNQTWLERIGAPRSNIVIYGNTGFDMEQDKKTSPSDICTESDRLLASFVDAMEWQMIVLAYVTQRYV